MTVAYGTVPFQEQIAFFRRKRNVLTESYLDIWGSQHDTNFMVAGANRDALLADLREAIRKAKEEGATLADFRRDFDRIVATHGWDYNGGRNWRSRVIYETNLRQSYNAGRWAQLQGMKKARPWWRYRHSDSVQHPRPLHVAWDGMILHCDDPWWLTHFPANGWGCQCYVEALSDRDLKRLGKTGPDKAPAIDMQTVIVGQRSPGGPREVYTPAGIDPGFGYAPGSSFDDWPAGRGGPQTPPSLRAGIQHALQDALEKSTRLPAAPAATSAAQALALPRAPDALQAGFVQWRRSVAALGNTAPRYLMGALTPPLTTTLQQAGIAPLTAALQLTAERWTAGTLAQLVATQAEQLPLAMRNPLAVLLDTATSRLQYVLPAGRRQRLVVDVVLQIEGAQAANSIVGASIATAQDLHRLVDGGRLQLLEGDIGT